MMEMAEAEFFRTASHRLEIAADQAEGARLHVPTVPAGFRNSGRSRCTPARRSMLLDDHRRLEFMDRPTTGRNPIKITARSAAHALQVVGIVDLVHPPRCRSTPSTAVRRADGHRGRGADTLAGMAEQNMSFASVGARYGAVSELMPLLDRRHSARLSLQHLDRAASTARRKAALREQGRDADHGRASGRHRGDAQANRQLAVAVAMNGRQRIGGGGPQFELLS